MLKKIAIAGAVAAAIVGVGTAAVAVSGSTGPTRPAAAARAGGDHPALRQLARHAVHGQFVTRGPDSKFVTHDVIRGKVTSVSSTAVSVKAADGVTESFVVTSGTEVRIRSNGKGAAGTIGQVHTGDKVLVLGTGADTFTATYVIDIR